MDSKKVTKSSQDRLRLIVEREEIHLEQIRIQTQQIRELILRMQELIKTVRSPDGSLPPKDK